MSDVATGRGGEVRSAVMVPVSENVCPKFVRCLNFKVYVSCRSKTVGNMAPSKNSLNMHSWSLISRSEPFLRAAACRWAGTLTAADSAVVPIGIQNFGVTILSKFRFENWTDKYVWFRTNYNNSHNKVNSIFIILLSD